MPTYLITGVAGFIGSNIARALLARGENVRGVDNFITGKRENLADLEGHRLHRGHHRRPRGLRPACHGVDFIFHEAALASVPRSVTDPIPTNSANVTGTAQSAGRRPRRRSHAHRLRRIVFRLRRPAHPAQA